MDTNKLDSLKPLIDSHTKECEARWRMQDENLEIIKLNFEQALKAKSKSELLTLKVNVSAMRTLFKINKKNLVKRPSFKINDESFVLPDVYKFLIPNIIQLEKFIDTRILVIEDEKSVEKIDSLSDRKTPDHSKLLKALSQYITGIDGLGFTNIIEHHLLTPGTPKANWIKSKVSASYFAEYLNMENDEWNKLFSFPDGKPLHGHHKDRLKKGSPIIDILKNHLNK